MYDSVSEMKCRACGVDHPVHLRCEMFKNAATLVLNEGSREVAPLSPLKDSKPSPVVAAPIKQAQDFIKKVGRPKKYPDRKTQMRELMRKRRARLNQV